MEFALYRFVFQNGDVNPGVRPFLCPGDKSTFASSNGVGVTEPRAMRKLEWSIQGFVILLRPISRAALDWFSIQKASVDSSKSTTWVLPTAFPSSMRSGAVKLEPPSLEKASFTSGSLETVNHTRAITELSAASWGPFTGCAGKTGEEKVVQVHCTERSSEPQWPPRHAQSTVRPTAKRCPGYA
jgi:hypothetical protein